MRTELFMSGASWSHVYAATLPFAPDRPDSLSAVTREYDKTLGLGFLGEFASRMAVAIPPLPGPFTADFDCTIPVNSGGWNVFYDHTLTYLRIRRGESLEIIRRRDGWEIGIISDSDGERTAFTRAQTALGMVHSPTARDRELLSRLAGQRNIARNTFLDALGETKWVDPRNCDWGSEPNWLSPGGVEALAEDIQALGWSTRIVPWPGPDLKDVKVLVASPKGGYTDECEWKRLNRLGWVGWPYGLTEADPILRDVPIALIVP